MKGIRDLKIVRLSIFCAMTVLLTVATAGCNSSSQVQVERSVEIKQVNKLLLDKATAGDVEAQYIIGSMYRRGTGVAQDFEEAAKWFRLAAQQGHAPSQNALGLLYERGIGVEQMLEKAVYWYRRAAEQGFGPAQTNLGFMYMSGNGVPQDDCKALDWIKRGSTAARS